MLKRVYTFIQKSIAKSVFQLFAAIDMYPIIKSAYFDNN